MKPSVELEVMQPGQSLSGLTARLLTELESTFRVQRPDMVLAHGDTTTCFASAISCFYHQIPFLHVEAGLRTHRLNSPFPEEFNRQSTARLARHHFAPTPVEKEHLLSDGILPSAITVTGSTVHDAVRMVLSRSSPEPIPQKPDCGQLVAVTLHRREAGNSLVGVLKGIRRAAIERPDALFVCPVHPNPMVKMAFREVLSKVPNVVLSDPLEYPKFLSLISRATLVVTDSGGVQEEAALLGKRVLLARAETERLDGIQSGLVSLMGLDPEMVRESILGALKGGAPGLITDFTDQPSASDIIAEKVERMLG